MPELTAADHEYLAAIDAVRAAEEALLAARARLAAAKVVAPMMHAILRDRWRRNKAAQRATKSAIKSKRQQEMQQSQRQRVHRHAGELEAAKRSLQ